MIKKVVNNRPFSGKNLQSSIDIHLQNYGELLMKNKRGSIVALEPSTEEDFQELKQWVSAIRLVRVVTRVRSSLSTLNFISSSKSSI